MCFFRKTRCSMCPADVNYNPAHEGAYQVWTGQPNCADYRATLKRHAQQLVAAGVDHVLVDMTNLEGYTATSDAIQLRPFEVLVQEWAALRKQVHVRTISLRTNKAKVWVVRRFSAESRRLLLLDWTITMFWRSVVNMLFLFLQPCTSLSLTSVPAT